MLDLLQAFFELFGGAISNFHFSWDHVKLDGVDDSHCMNDPYNLLKLLFGCLHLLRLVTLGVEIDNSQILLLHPDDDAEIGRLEAGLIKVALSWDSSRLNDLFFVVVDFLHSFEYLVMVSCSLLLDFSCPL